MARYTLSKTERLSSLKAISQLFETGQSLARSPVRLVWAIINDTEESTPPVKVMFNAPKKKFPRAVDRNRIKRLMRESYRLRKPALFEAIPPSQHFHLAILFTGNEMPDLPVIQKGINEALDRWLIKITALTPKAKT